MAFDTYRAVKELEEVGFDESAASAMVNVVSNAFTDNVATKSDIAVLATKADTATKADIADMATKVDIANMATKADVAELRSELHELETRLTVRSIWFAVSIVVITTSLTSGIVGLLNQLQS